MAESPSALPADADAWIHQHLDPVAPIELAHQRPWSTVWRVPLVDGTAWCKLCGPVQQFEPQLTADLWSRWPDLLPEVLGHDAERGFLLLGDAGAPIHGLGNPPELWEVVLPRYAELQREETSQAPRHRTYGVPDLRVSTLPDRFEDLVRQDLPLEAGERSRLRTFGDRFARWCEELEGHGIAGTVQHDDLHMNNVYEKAGHLRVLDWGDASVSHPFASLVVTFRFLEERNGLHPGDRWYARLRDAYLEPWGRGRNEAFALALRVGSVAHAIAWARQRGFLDQEARRTFDEGFSIVLRRALVELGQVSR
jgi:hypothetical protein